MEKTDRKYGAYVEILNKDLLVAMGCTEPIAVALAAAKARECLGGFPDRVSVEASSNIIKNVKSVIVPNTDGRKGLEAAAAIGIIAGDSGKGLEVISSAAKRQKAALQELLDRNIITVGVASSDLVLDIVVTMFRGTDQVKVRIAGHHTNIVLVEKNGARLIDAYCPLEAGITDGLEDFYQLLSVKDIIDFADNCDIEDVRPVLQRQIDYNTAIAREGLRGDWGANVGSAIIKHYPDDVAVRAAACAAAGSDARMSGCELPVVINSGSGNQGLTVSMPVVEYARSYQVDPERTLRALAVSNLLSIHQKHHIGCLSAYCGAVSAGCAAGAGICYLLGGDLNKVSHVFVNGSAINSGVICDGAKPSCAAKIASAVTAGIFAWHMTEDKQQFRDGEGIVKKGVENTIKSVGRLGKNGMRETDREILNIMMVK